MSFFHRLLRLPQFSSSLFALILVLVSSSAQAGMTGADWLDSSADMKQGVVLGVLTVIDAERSFRVADEQCASAEPTLIHGLGHMKVPQLQQALESYYQQHPEQRNRAISHAIWALAEQQIK